MFHGRFCVFSHLAAIGALALSASGQSVVSARAGVVHFFEGSVYLDDEALQPHLGRFPSMPAGSELRTALGRAEVLLTPGVLIRIGDRSAIRMIANDLSDTRVELLEGSAMVDAGQPSSGTSATLIYKNWTVHFLEKGVYRIDSEPPRLWVLQGDADVSSATGPTPVSVESGMYLPFAPVLVPDRSVGTPQDALSDWSRGRNQSITADNAIAANIQDPASMDLDLGLDPFTYYPMLGLPSLGPGVSGSYLPYSAFAPYQPGFNSIYLPGYTYQPYLLGLPRNRTGGLITAPTRIGTFLVPYRPIPLPRPTPARPMPAPTTIRPVSPVTVRPAPHVAAPVGVHR
jgi:hypothetical protein